MLAFFSSLSLTTIILSSSALIGIIFAFLSYRLSDPNDFAWKLWVQILVLGMLGGMVVSLLFLLLDPTGGPTLPVALFFQKIGMGGVVAAVSGLVILFIGRHLFRFFQPGRPGKGKERDKFAAVRIRD